MDIKEKREKENGRITDLQLGLQSTQWSLQLKLRIPRESSLEGEKTGSMFDVEFEERVGGTPVERQQAACPCGGRSGLEAKI